MTVSPVNDPPQILLDPEGPGLLPSGGALGTDEDILLPLEMFAIHDNEMSAGGGGRLTVSLQCSNGGIAVSSDKLADEEDDEPLMEVVWVVGGGAEAPGTGPWQAVVFSGGLAQANAVLSKLEYVPSPHWHGVDELKVSFKDINGAGGESE